MAEPGRTLSSPAQLLAQLAQNVGGEAQLQARVLPRCARRRCSASPCAAASRPPLLSPLPALQGLLESVQRAQAGAAGPPPPGALEVFPEPAWVVKTATEEGQKVFINVVGSPKLPLPGGWQAGRVPDEARGAGCGLPDCCCAAASSGQHPRAPGSTRERLRCFAASHGPAPTCCDSLPVPASPCR